MKFDEDKWDAYLARTYDSIEEAFANASNKTIVDCDGIEGTAGDVLEHFVIDNNDLCADLMQVLRNSNAEEVIALRRKAGTMWAEKYCEVQALFDERFIENDTDY